MPTRRPVTAPIPIDFALIGATAVQSARLRDGRVFPIVVDAMVLIEDALWRVSNRSPTMHPSERGVVPYPAPSSLSRLVAIHAARLYGKPDLLDEVVEHLPRVAKSRERADGALALIRAEYAPAMRLVDPSGISLPDAEARLSQVRGVDPDDEPTARLSRLLDPSLLLTKDRKALLRFGFGLWVEDSRTDAFVGVTGDEWLRASITVSDQAFTTQMEVGGRAVIMTSNIAVDGARKAISLARENPIPSAVLLGGMLMLLWMTRSSSFWVELRSGIGTATSATLSEIAARTEGRPQAAALARATLQTYLAAHRGPEVPEAKVARALAIAEPDGLSAADLYAITGHRFAVLPILEMHRAFERDGMGRWHLGRAATSGTSNTG